MDHIVVQPDGRLATFCDHHYYLMPDLGIGEAKERLMESGKYELLAEANFELKMARMNLPMDIGYGSFSQTIGPQHMLRRWNDALTIIKEVHGAGRLQEELRDAGFPDYELQPVCVELRIQLEKLKADTAEWREEDSEEPPASSPY